MRNSVRFSACSITLFLVILSSLFTACNAAPPHVQRTPTLSNSPQTAPVPLNSPVATTGCHLPPAIPPGTSKIITIAAYPPVSEGDSTRTYLLHIPTGYDPLQPLPLVLVFHGYGGDAAGMENATGLSHLADQQHFIVAYGQGEPDGAGGPPMWASLGPLDHGLDDLLYVSDILNDAQRTLCVDVHRIYATGFSNGGGMTVFLACRMAHRIAAFAPMSANLYTIPGGCNPERPVPLLYFHGTADTVVPYQGIPVSVNPQWPLPPVQQWLQDWAARDSCTIGPAITLRQPDVTGEQWSGCAAHVIVLHYRLEHTGHAMPTTINGLPAMEVIWHFFQAYPLP